jgi:hypothetical protein
MNLSFFGSCVHRQHVDHEASSVSSCSFTFFVKPFSANSVTSLCLESRCVRQPIRPNLLSRHLVGLPNSSLEETGDPWKQLIRLFLGFVGPEIVTV